MSEKMSFIIGKSLEKASTYDLASIRKLLRNDDDTGLNRELAIEKTIKLEGKLNGFANILTTKEKPSKQTKPG